jgi:hypothetical protein
MNGQVRSQTGLESGLNAWHGVIGLGPVGAIPPILL